MSRNCDLLFYGIALNLSIKFPCNLTKNTFCLPLGRPHRTYLCIYGYGSWTLPFTRLIAQSEFKTAPDLYWNTPSVWQKLCQHDGLMDVATVFIAAQVTQLSLEKEDCCRVRSCSSNRDSPALQMKSKAINLCCKTTTFTAKWVYDWRSGSPEKRYEHSSSARCSITIKQS